jgi:hypothetical protein
MGLFQKFLKNMGADSVQIDQPGSHEPPIITKSFAKAGPIADESKLDTEGDKETPQYKRPWLEMGQLYGLILAEVMHQNEYGPVLERPIKFEKMGNFFEYLNQRPPDHNFGTEVLKKMVNSARILKKEIYQKCGWIEGEGSIMWLPEIFWETSPIQEHRLNHTLHKDDEVKLALKVLTNDEGKQYQSLNELAYEVVSKGAYSIKNPAVITDLLAADNQTLAKIFQEKNINLTQIFEQSGKQLGIREIINILSEVNKDDFKKCPSLRLMRFITDIYDYVYFDFDRVAGNKFQAELIEERFHKIIMSGSARSDLVGFKAKSGDHEATKILAEFKDLTLGKMFGRRPLLDLSAKTDLMNLENSRSDAGIRLLEMISSGRIKYSVIELKTEQFSNSINNGVISDRVFNPESPDIKPEYLSDIGHTLWAIFEYLTAEYGISGMTDVKNPEKVKEFLRLTRGFNTKEINTGNITDNGANLYKIYKTFIEDFLKQDNRIMVAVVNAPFFKRTQWDEVYIENGPDDLPVENKVTKTGWGWNRDQDSHLMVPPMDEKNMTVFQLDPHTSYQWTAQAGRNFIRSHNPENK